ncbi:hypothetical protein EKI60_04990 [Candidatus Saccharibacteria bacterium]|nr:MAG: hypothetical protein EKI60_04990 [Candidatus Saccharibacteria bacterium]
MKNIKSKLGYVVLVLTVLVFAWYLRSNPAVIDNLSTTRLSTVLVLLALYGLMTAVLAYIFGLMLKMCNAHIPAKENILFTMYSSVINFFGPLQSGPGFRLVYLKKKFNVSMRAYGGANVVYYLMFAAISGLFLLSSLIPVVLLVIAAVAAAPFGWYVLPALRKRVPRLRKVLPDLPSIGIFVQLGCATLVQLLLVTCVYWVELRSLESTISFSQALTYAGAANFALFVSLTPGALGFRESFLFLSERLHGIDNATVVSANVLDRAVYVLFLGILFAIILAMHGQRKFSQFKQPKSD